MSLAPEPSLELRAARRELHSIDGFELTEDIALDVRSGNWILRCRLTVATDRNSEVPATTNWLIEIDQGYPSGTIKVLPALDSGLERTFPHQNYNMPLEDRRSGKLCLDADMHTLGRGFLGTEPIEPSERLSWHVRRAVEWLTLASRGELLRDGDPFELPAVPVSADLLQVVFSEGPESFGVWNGAPARVGFFEMYRIDGGDVAVKSFLDVTGEIIHEPTWGTYVTNANVEPKLGAWLQLPFMPVLVPWHIPATWGELREHVAERGLNLDDLLGRVAWRLRDGLPHVLLIGFAIPSIVGEPPTQQHWLAVGIPKLADPQAPPSGWRNNMASLWRYDVSRTIGNSASIVWLQSFNWNQEEIATRGRADEPLRGRAIAILGVGALGSTIAEHLARLGVQRLLLIDPDDLTVGNLVRHNLVLHDVGKNKAQALAERLNSVSPHIRVDYISESFPRFSDADLQQIEACSIVLDCTASDDVLARLGDVVWANEKIFVSCSVGIYARRLFLFTAGGTTFDADAFHQQLRPWLERDRADHGDVAFPREGIGCWHPVFPARIDDFSLWSSFVVRHLEALGAATVSDARLDVFEQRFMGRVLSGVERATGGS